jgi:hypothetical protein
VLVTLGEGVDLGDRIEVPILVDGAYDILSGEYGLSFDPTELYVINAVPSGLSAGSMSAWHSPGSSLSLAMAHSTAYGGDGAVALLTLGKLSGESDLSSLTLESVKFNSGDPPAEIGGSSGVTPVFTETGLGPAVPNPFTQGTVLSYQLATSGHVSLAVYNVEGQLVRRLLDGVSEAGSHRVLWDGRDEVGSEVSRGVYFCRMECEGFRATSKVVLVR